MTPEHRIQWRMVSKNNYVGELNGYVISINPPPYWQILKDGVVIDNCYYHSPTTGELQAKVQSEKVLRNILNQSNQK